MKSPFTVVRQQPNGFVLGATDTAGAWCSIDGHGWDEFLAWNFSQQSPDDLLPRIDLAVYKAAKVALIQARTQTLLLNGVNVSLNGVTARVGMDQLSLNVYNGLLLLVVTQMFQPQGIPSVDRMSALVVESPQDVGILYATVQNRLKYLYSDSSVGEVILIGQVYLATDVVGVDAVVDSRI